MYAYRYDNLKPIGDGSYGLVASADDKLMGDIYFWNYCFQFYDKLNLICVYIVLEFEGTHFNIYRMFSLL